MNWNSTSTIGIELQWNDRHLMKYNGGSHVIVDCAFVDEICGAIYIDYNFAENCHILVLKFKY